MQSGEHKANGVVVSIAVRIMADPGSNPGSLLCSMDYTSTQPLCPSTHLPTEYQLCMQEFSVASVSYMIGNDSYAGFFMDV